MIRLKESLLWGGVKMSVGRKDDDDDDGHTYRYRIAVYMANRCVTNIKIVIAASANNDGYPTEMRGWLTNDTSNHQFDDYESKVWCDLYHLENVGKLILNLKKLWMLSSGLVELFDIIDDEDGHNIITALNPVARSALLCYQGKYTPMYNVGMSIHVERQSALRYPISIAFTSPSSQSQITINKHITPHSETISDDQNLSY
ncbi:hypothetical protein BC833DRAFT_570296 [Globomyces pollinis-pini]|nr:hypothetical protein BC833DRAFT_570296 [Globomyces pollinis-pini]